MSRLSRLLCRLGLHAWQRSWTPYTPAKSFCQQCGAIREKKS